MSVGQVTTVAAKPLGTLIFAIFFKSLDGKPGNFGSEHFSTCPNFYYLDILLSLKYLRHFPLTRNVNPRPTGGGGAISSPPLSFSSDSFQTNAVITTKLAVPSLPTILHIV